MVHRSYHCSVAIRLGFVAAIAQSLVSPPLAFGQASSSMQAVGEFSAHSPLSKSGDPPARLMLTRAEFEARVGRPLPHNQDWTAPGASNAESDGGDATLSKRRALETASRFESSAHIEVRLFFDPGTFDPVLLRSAPSDQRRLFIQAQNMDMEEHRAAVSEAAERAGGEVLSVRWLDRSVLALVPAGKTDTLLELNDVDRAYVPTESDSVFISSNGTDLRELTLGTTLYNQDIRGETGGHSSTNGDNIKLGIIENNPLNTAHQGWLDWPYGPSRVRSAKDCTGATCVAGATTTVATHATTVTWVAAGSIQQGQDPNITSAEDRGARSGIASEADIYFYKIADMDDVVDAYQEAVTQGVDVLNMSFFTGCGGSPFCVPDKDCANLNANLRTVTEAGVLIVMAAGNHDDPNPAPNCDVNWPAFRPEVISVTGADTDEPTDDYDTLPAWSGLSSGNVSITTASGFAAITPAVDLMAPAAITNSFREFANGQSFYKEGAPGNPATSWAAPVVTGLSGLLREALTNVGWDASDAYMLKAHALLMGDWDSADSYYNAPSSTMGHGRVRAHWPFSPLLVAPWGWGWRSFVIHQGEQVAYPVWDTGPESALVTKWKWVLFAKDHDMSSTTYLIASVHDTCAGGAYVRGDYTATINKRITLDGADVGGKCLEMRVYGYQVPPEGVVVYSADYFQSGDPTLH